MKGLQFRVLRYYRTKASVAPVKHLLLQCNMCGSDIYLVTSVCVNVTCVILVCMVTRVVYVTLMSVCDAEDHL